MSAATTNRLSNASVVIPPVEAARLLSPCYATLQAESGVQELVGLVELAQDIDLLFGTTIGGARLGRDVDDAPYLLFVIGRRAFAARPLESGWMLLAVAEADAERFELGTPVCFPPNTLPPPHRLPVRCPIRCSGRLDRRAAGRGR